MISYISTRGGGSPKNFEDVLLTGLAPDGGLYVPQTWPRLDLEKLKGKSYAEIAKAVMYPFVEGCIEEDVFSNIVDETYGLEIFRHADVVPLHKLYPNLYTLELFHGPTIAFKDVALQLLGRLFDHVLQKHNQNVTIVGATSGDTGSAAIEGCRHSKHLNVFILFPDGRVSDVQRRQMTTVAGDNIHNIALKGTFDDCQNLVKAMFNDTAFRSEINLSAINSINWARIMAQIVYYVTSALALGAPEKKVSFVVPTGNFGNVYAAYCARKMGLEIDVLAISTNRNDILTRFFETNVMEKRGVHASLSPSMDIEISSNFERYLFDALDRDSARLKSYMEDFAKTGRVDLSAHSSNIRDFQAFRADDAQTLSIIQKVYSDTGYILDPHTAVGMKGALELAQDQNRIVISLACAHPAKFPDAIEKAIGQKPPLPEHLKDLFSHEERLTKLENDLFAVQDFVRKKSTKISN